VQHLAPLAQFAEAEAALALYDYYKAQLLKGVAWLPFVKADRQGTLNRLEAAIPRSPYLGEILETSLLWIYYDAGRYGDGLPAIRNFLARHPGNRPYRQMLADFLFRRGDTASADLDSALALHVRLAAEYQALKAVYPPPAYLPLGYLCSVGNLAKIYASRPSSQKRSDLLEQQFAIWYSPEYSGIMKWLPASLEREVSTLRKENPAPKREPNSR
jgi:hypothetical protein